MARIIGLENMTSEQLQAELQMGGRFVIFQFCISAVVMSFKRSSDIYFIRAQQSAFSKGLSFSALTLCFGWWGIPWGPIWSLSTLFTNFTGGKNVTKEVMQSLTS
jgi:hypothetical protein